VGIFWVSPAGGEVTLFRFGPGPTFGFMPSLDGGSSPSSAEARTEVEADAIARGALRSVFAANPDAAPFLVPQRATRLRASMENFTRPAFQGVLPRVAAALLALRDPSRPFAVALPVSARQFAAGRAGRFGHVPRAEGLRLRGDRGS
jgi:CRP-like cAMP-binding protein